MEEILFNTKEIRPNIHIGIALLNAPQRLNSLSLEMSKQLLDHLQKWHLDKRIVAVIIEASGDKAFCAGGDIKAARDSSLAHPNGPCPEAEAFFISEYTLNYLMHHFTKPIIAFGQGYIMGGGMGVFEGAQFKIVGKQSILAMPEISIALYPDVGAGYFYNNLPSDIGLFLGLTGAQLNCRDALFLELADYVIAEADFSVVKEELFKIEYNLDSKYNSELIANLFLNHAANIEHTPCNISMHLNTIMNLIKADGLIEIYKKITNYNTDPWLKQCIETLQQGSPLAAWNIYNHFKRCKGLSIDKVFEYEMDLTTNIMRNPEFAEGVRALVVDKDKNPNWLYKSLEEVPDSLKEKMMSSPFNENPLKTLNPIFKSIARTFKKPLYQRAYQLSFSFYF